MFETEGLKLKRIRNQEPKIFFILNSSFFSLLVSSFLVGWARGGKSFKIRVVGACI